jgi:integrase
MKRERTKFTGVYQRYSTTRTHAGKPDICFDIAFRLDGKLIWEKIGWASEGYSPRLAADIRSERMRTMRHGEELPQQKNQVPLFDEIWRQYKTWAETNKARGGRDDISLYSNCLEKPLGQKRMNKISSFELEGLKSSLSKNGYSAATVKHCLVLVRQIYNKAVVWGKYKGENPVSGVKMPVLQNQKTRFLSHEEANDLLLQLSQMREKNLHDMALLSLYTGMRAGEIFNLKGNDLDFQNDLIRITDHKNKSTRYAYMTKTIKDMLNARRPGKPEGLVFPARKRDHYKTGAQKQNGEKKIDAVSRRFRLIIKKMGLNEGITDPRQKVTFHTLRHTFASWLAIQGESLITIKELLGHKSMAMTERYSHLTPDHKHLAVKNLEAGFKRKPKIISIEKAKS